MQAASVSASASNTAAYAHRPAVLAPAHLAPLVPRAPPVPPVLTSPAPLDPSPRPLHLTSALLPRYPPALPRASTASLLLLLLVVSLPMLPLLLLLIPYSLPFLYNPTSKILLEYQFPYTLSPLLSPNHLRQLHVIQFRFSMILSTPTRPSSSCNLASMVSLDVGSAVTPLY